jgi:hypothetical protein
MAKVVSNSAGFSATPQSGRQTFADVPVGSVFYLYIERLAMNNAVAPWPPDWPSPGCSSSNQPCYYPSTNAHRIDAVVQTLLGRGATDPSRYAQVFPHKSGQFDGIQSYAVNPGTCPILGAFASPVALTDYYNAHFVESGFSVYYDYARGQCVVHPYGSWFHGYPGESVHQITREDIFLQFSTGYTFRTDPSGYHVWTSKWCDITQCINLITTEDMGRSTFPYVVAGGESQPWTQTWGIIHLYDNYFRRFGDWFTWCYDPRLAPVVIYNRVPTTISPCNYNAWAVNYWYQPARVFQEVKNASQVG